VAGYLADQGVPDDVVVHYNKSFLDGGSILAIAVPTGSLTAEEAEAVMAKYGATNVATVNAPRMLSEGTAIQPDEPLVVQSDNPEIAPVAFATPAVPTARVVEEDIVAPGPMIEMIDPSSGVVTTQPVVPVAVDPTIGAEYVVPPMAPAAGVTTLPPNIELVPDSAGMYHQTVGHSTVVNEEPAIVTDPVTGLARSATIVEEQRAVVVDPAAMDVEGHAVVPIEGPEQTIIVREKHVEIPD
jgi:hypothetical protein